MKNSGKLSKHPMINLIIMVSFFPTRMRLMPGTDVANGREIAI